jgi:hypothetical protein
MNTFSPAYPSEPRACGGYAICPCGCHHPIHDSDGVVPENFIVPAQTYDDPEIQAMSVVYSALKGLDYEAQERVLDWVTRRGPIMAEVLDK